MGLTSAEISLPIIIGIEVMADNKSGSARASSRNILEAFYGYDQFCDCIDRNGHKSSNSFSYKDEADTPLSIEASPNPATHYVEFSYELSEIDTEGVIMITDINGKTIQTFNIKHEKGKQAWDTRNIPSGSYIYTLKTQYFEDSGKLIIQ